jgi:hypothetical protein
MEKWSLTALADGLLSHALSASGRSSTRTIHGGPPHHRLCQTMRADSGGKGPSPLGTGDTRGDAGVGRAGTVDGVPRMHR